MSYIYQCFSLSLTPSVFSDLNNTMKDQKDREHYIHFTKMRKLSPRKVTWLTPNHIQVIFASFNKQLILFLINITLIFHKFKTVEFLKIQAKILTK